MRDSLIFLIFAGFRIARIGPTPPGLWRGRALAGTDGTTLLSRTTFRSTKLAGDCSVCHCTSSLLVVFRFGLTWFYLAAIGA
jgi:hypothetical protein